MQVAIAYFYGFFLNSNAFNLTQHQSEHISSHELGLGYFF